jgi:hypothetical protein
VPQSTFIYEGPRLAEPLRSATLNFGALHGWGLPVEAAGASTVQLATETKDQQHLNLYLPPMLNRSTRQLWLRSAIEPREGHAVVVWPTHGTTATSLHHVPIEKVQPEQDGLLWTLPPFPQPRALAISYEGVCLGAWWDQGAVLHAIQQYPSQQLFALLRWFKVPVLAPAYRKAVEAIAQKHPVAFLQAWLLGLGLPAGLNHREFDPGIETVTRFLLWNLCERRERVLDNLLTAFTRSSAPADLDRAFLEATRLCPTLAWWLAEHRRKGRKQAKRVLRHFLDTSVLDPRQIPGSIDALRDRFQRATGEPAPSLQPLLTALQSGRSLDVSKDCFFRRVAETVAGRDYLCASILHAVSENE